MHYKFGTKVKYKEKWPPRSPNLSTCHFFIWGYLKSKVYYHLPSNIEGLKTNIEREIKSINADMLKNSFENFRKKLELVISAEGGPFDLFKIKNNL